VTEDLLSEIVRKVLEEMESRGLGTPAATTVASSAPTAPAPTPTPTPTPPSPAVTVPPASEPTPQKPASKTETPKKIFVTADMLAQRLAAEGGQTKVLELAHNEFLTPAAVDLADQRHLTVRKKPLEIAKVDETPAQGQIVTASPAVTVQPGAASGVSRGSQSLGLVIRQPNETVRGVLEGLGRQGFGAVEFGASDCWIENTRQLCESVAAGRIAGGVVMIPVAAEALIVANKVPGIRAVQGGRVDTLTRSIARLAPNVLVLEHSSCTFHELRTMLRTFATGLGSRGKNEAVLKAIAELERS